MSKEISGCVHTATDKPNHRPTNLFNFITFELKHSWNFITAFKTFLIWKNRFSFECIVMINITISHFYSLYMDN